MLPQRTFQISRSKKIQLAFWRGSGRQYAMCSTYNPQGYAGVCTGPIAKKCRSLKACQLVQAGRRASRGPRPAKLPLTKHTKQKWLLCTTLGLPGILRAWGSANVAEPPKSPLRERRHCAISPGAQSHPVDGGFLEAFQLGRSARPTARTGQGAKSAPG